MERNELLDRQYKMLKHISYLPRKILTLHSKENITEFVLHELCNEQCFNLNKAAFFIDNPDFNCTKGVAGFSRSECAMSCPIWDDPAGFTQQMQNSEFNRKVRHINRCSLKRVQDSHEQLAGEIAKDLGFKNHGFCTWPMKHDNEGFVVYEKVLQNDTYADEHMVDGLSLLGFCPVY